MKKILLFAFLFCSFSAFAQYPAQPTTKQELGRQTTGDGLIYRGSGAPAYTPSNNRNAWIYYDTLNNRLYKSRLGSWSLMVQDTSAFNEIQMPYIIDDTLYLTQNVTGEPLTRYVNRVWPITNLSDTTSITGENQGDVAIVATGDTVAFRGSAYWNPFSGGGGGGTFNDFILAGDTGSSTITDGQTVTIAGGYGINTAESGGTATVTADTSELVTPYDISGMPSGSGTNQRIVVWTGTNSQGNSTLLQSAAGVALDANLAFRITGGTTASRPTGAAGMMYWNTSNGWWDYHNGTSWFNPARAATSNGLFTAGSVLFGHSDGTVQQDNATFFWDDTDNKLILGATTASGTFARLNIRGTTTTTAGKSLSIYNSSGINTFSIFDNGWLEIVGAGYILPLSGNVVMEPLASNGGFVFSNNSVRFVSGQNFRFNIATHGFGTSSPDRMLHVEESSATTNAVVSSWRTSAISTGTVVPGFGVRVIEGEAENASNTNRIITEVDAVYTTATNAAEVSDLVFRTMRVGTLTESLRSLGNGTLKIGTLSGTASKIGAFTSGNIATVVTPTITAGGTTGDRTINELAGTVNIAAAGTTVTVTNSLVTANSLVFCTLRTNDTTATVKNVVPTAGGFTINLGAAATGEVSIGFFVVN